jgi:hypothetical protein
LLSDSIDKNMMEEKYPNISRWVDGRILEIGYESETDSFIRAIDEGGTVFEGKSSYKTLDDALDDAEKAIGDRFEENE